MAALRLILGTLIGAGLGTGLFHLITDTSTGSWPLFTPFTYVGAAVGFMGALLLGDRTG